MGTRNFELSETLDRFVDDRVRSGGYEDASEVVRAGLDLLKDRSKKDALKIQRLRAAIQVGLDEMDRGEGEQVGDLEAWFDSLEAASDRR